MSHDSWALIGFLLFFFACGIGLGKWWSDWRFATYLQKNFTFLERVKIARILAKEEPLE